MLRVRSTADGFPTLAPDVLGVDGSGSPPSWGHMSRAVRSPAARGQPLAPACVPKSAQSRLHRLHALSDHCRCSRLQALAARGVTTLRFWARSGCHNRTIHFTCAGAGDSRVQQVPGGSSSAGAEVAAARALPAHRSTSDPGLIGYATGAASSWTPSANPWYTLATDHTGAAGAALACTVA